MIQSAFIAVNARDVLARHGLDSFEALWCYGTSDGTDIAERDKGWKKVIRIDLEDANGESQSFYLKRQNHQLVRSLRHPLGEPTFVPFNFSHIWAFPRWKRLFLTNAGSRVISRPFFLPVLWIYTSHLLTGLIDGRRWHGVTDRI